MAVRGAIEQIEPLELGPDQKIKPVLHSFRFGVRDDWSKTRVRIRHFELKYNPVAASQPRNFRDMTSEARNEIESHVRGLSYISDAYFTKEGFDIVFNTHDPVKITRATIRAVEAIWVQADEGVGALPTNTEVSLESESDAEIEDGD